jgi:cell division septum initiation protein DivIVA
MPIKGGQKQMTVTTEQSKGKRFATVRRDGYDQGEVDRHVEIAEQAVRDLTAKCAGLEEANTTMRAALVTANERARVLEDELARRAAEPVTPAPVASAPVVEDTVRTASHSASRMLELATREAEALVADARREADQALSAARVEAADTIQKCLDKVHAREEALDAMAAQQREELEEMRAETLKELEARRSDLEARVTDLTDFEGQVRSHLVDYFNQQLAALEQPSAVQSAVVFEHPHAS